MKNWKDKYENELTEINKQSIQFENEIKKEKELLNLLRNNNKISLFLKDLKKSVSIINEVNSRSSKYNINISLDERIFGENYLKRSEIHRNYDFDSEVHIILQSNNDTNKKRVCTINLDKPQKPQIIMYNCRTEYKSNGEERVYKNEWIHTDEGFEQDYDLRSTGSDKVVNIIKKKSKTLNLNELNSELSNSIIGWLLFEKNGISSDSETINSNVNTKIFFKMIGESIGVLVFIAFVASFITPLIIGFFTGSIHYWNYYIISFISIILIGFLVYVLILKDEFD